MIFTFIMSAKEEIKIPENEKNELRTRFNLI